MKNPTPAPERTLTEAERADEAARTERARVIGGVRRNACPPCGARAYGPCQVSSPGDCLARWLSASALGWISREDVTKVVAGLVVITAGQLVGEHAR